MSNIFDQLTASTEKTNDSIQDETTSNNESHPSPVDVQYTPISIKEASQELLRFGLIESANKPKLYQTAITHPQALNEVLEPLDLSLTIDDVRGLAFVVVAESMARGDGDEWTHPLIRKQRLTMEQSLLLAILREFYVNHELENGIGSAHAIIPIAELQPRMGIYLGELGSEMAEEKRLRNILDKLKAHGVVSEIDKFDQVIIRPIITHLANPENLTSLLQTLQQHAALNGASGSADTHQQDVPTGEATPDEGSNHL